MNKARRNALAKALPMLQQAATLIAQAREQVSTVHDDEDEAHGNLSDGQRDGDLGSEMAQIVSDLSDARDSLDAIDLAAVARSLSEIADAVDPSIAPPALDEEQLNARRLARLAPWAREMIDRAEGRAAAADRRLAEAFGTPDEEDARRIVIDDYCSPLRGKVIPAEAIAFPALGVRISATRDGRSIELHATDMGNLVVRGQAANVMLVRVERGW